MTENIFGVNGSGPAPQQQANPVDLWPVPVAPMLGSLGFAIVDAIFTDPEGKQQVKKMVRIDLYNQGGSAFTFFDPQDLIGALQKGIHFAKAAKSGLEIPPGARL
jgi:hypothetical protein